jgi:hypothetical protein
MREIGLDGEHWNVLARRIEVWSYRRIRTGAVRKTIMGFLKLNRYGHASGMVFEPDLVITKLQATFPEVRVFPGDQLAAAADRAAAAGAAEHVVQSLRRNQESHGPAFAFEIPMPGGGLIEGRARRHDVTFLFSDPLAVNWHRRLLAFLQGLGPGTLELAKEIDVGETVDV